MKTFRTWALGTAALVLAVVGFAYAQPIFSNNLFLLGGNAGVTPQMQAVGTDTNISINLVPKGTGTVQVNGSPVVSGLTPTFTTLTVTGLTTQQGGEVSTLGVTSGITSTLKSSPVRIFHATNDVTTVGTGEETAYTYVLPAASLATDGQMLRIDFWSLANAGGGNKQTKVKFGATTISDSTAAAFATNALLQTTCYLFRTGAATQKALCVVTDGANGTLSGGATTNTIKNLSTPAETLSGTVTILITQTTSVAAQLTSKFASIDWFPQGQ